MRISTQLAIFFVAFNLLSGAMMGMGIHEDLGINLETGDSEAIDTATNLDRPDTGNSEGGTLFGMYNAAAGQFGKVVNTIGPGFKMLKLFLPNRIVDPIAGIAGMIVFVDVVSYFAGRSA